MKAEKAEQSSIWEQLPVNSFGIKKSKNCLSRQSSTSASSSSMVHQMCSLAASSSSSIGNDYALSNKTHFPGRTSCRWPHDDQHMHHHHYNFCHTSSCFSSKRQTVLILCYFIAALCVCSSIPGTAGIDCFKCVSLNGDNPSCEDPFHNNYTVSILESPCMGGRKGRNGLFPATACIKLAGKYYDSGETITVRGCALDSGTLNVDTEIIRMSHCGHFWFNERYVKGCLQSCDDADGCNGSSRPSHFSTTTCIITTTLVLFLIGSITSTGLLPAYFFLPNNLVHQNHHHHRPFHFPGGIQLL